MIYILCLSVQKELAACFSIDVHVSPPQRRCLDNQKRTLALLTLQVLQRLMPELLERLRDNGLQDLNGKVISSTALQGYTPHDQVSQTFPFPPDGLQLDSWWLTVGLLVHSLLCSLTKASFFLWSYCILIEAAKNRQYRWWIHCQQILAWGRLRLYKFEIITLWLLSAQGASSSSCIMQAS